MADTATYALTPIAIYSGSAFVNIPGVTKVGGPSIEKGEIEITTMNSQGYREYISEPLANPGTFDFSLNFTPSNTVHKYLMKQATTTGSMNQWQINFADGVVYSFSGSLSKFGIKADNPASSVLSADASVKITGPVSGNFAV